MTILERRYTKCEKILFWFGFGFYYIKHYTFIYVIRGDGFAKPTKSKMFPYMNFKKPKLKIPIDSSYIDLTNLEREETLKYWQRCLSGHWRLSK